MAGFGIKVKTDIGRFVWLTEDGTSSVKAKALRFDSETGADIYCASLSSNNPDATLVVAKL